MKDALLAPWISYVSCTSSNKEHHDGFIENSAVDDDPGRSKRKGIPYFQKSALYVVMRSRVVDLLR